VGKLLMELRNNVIGVNVQIINATTNSIRDDPLHESVCFIAGREFLKVFGAGYIFFENGVRSLAYAYDIAKSSFITGFHVLDIYFGVARVRMREFYLHVISGYVFITRFEKLRLGIEGEEYHRRDLGLGIEIFTVIHDYDNPCRIP